MLIDEIKPFVRQAMIGRLTSHSKQTINHRLKTPDCRLFYIISASGNMVIENSVHTLKNGMTVLIPAGTEYMWQVADAKYYAINFDYTQNFNHIKDFFDTRKSETFDENEILEKINFENCDILNYPIVLSENNAMEDTFRLITTEFCMGGYLCENLVSSLTKSVILRIARTKNDISNKPDSKNALLIRSIIEYITTNYHKNISNTKIAEKFSFNPSYINRIFREQTNMGMHEFLINYRINNAIEMLSDHNLSIEEISIATGFNDLPHFSKTFKKRTGKSPIEYRQEYK